MSFGPPYPYGTPGGDEVIATAMNPPVYRIARGNSVIVFLHVNGRLAERLRENVEDVVRVLGLTGTVLVAIIVREEGVVRDANASDMDFQDGLTVTQIAPGVVTVEIGTGEITTAMLANGLISAVKLAGDALTGHVVNVAGQFGGTVTNASTVTWATAVTVSEVIPAGTWDMDVTAAISFIENTGTGCVAGFRIFSPITTVSYNQSQTGSDRTPVFLTGSGSVVSDGVTPTTFTAQFIRISSGTPRVENASILATCRRIS